MGWETCPCEWRAQRRQSRGRSPVRTAALQRVAVYGRFPSLPPYKKEALRLFFYLKKREYYLEHLREIVDTLLEQKPLYARIVCAVVKEDGRWMNPPASCPVYVRLKSFRLFLAED